MLNKIVLGMLFLGVGGVLSPSSYDEGKVVGRVESEILTEISGIVASRRQPDVFWVHNDSGDGPNIYAINGQGALLGTFEVQGARAVDWEDIAWGPGQDHDYLYIGDIGDNAAKRDNIVVYRVAEPVIDLAAAPVSVKTQPAQAYRFAYPDGPYDAETLILDPIHGDLFIVTKRQFQSRLYRGCLNQEKSAEKKLEFLRLLPVGFVVGGDISTDGSALVLRNLTQAWVWQRPEGTSVSLCFSGPSQAVTLLPEPQGEAICFSSNSDGIYTISEGGCPNLHFYAEIDTQ